MLTIPTYNGFLRVHFFGRHQVDRQHFKGGEVGDGGGSRPFVIAFYGEGLCPAVDFSWFFFSPP